MAVTCTLLSATRHHRSRASPSAAWCPRAIPVTRASLSTVRHHRLHITIGRMVPLSSACHPHIAVACASPFVSPLATWCPRAMPVTHTSPLTACHHRLHVTVSRMVRPSNARHLHVAIACASPFASPSATWCPQATPVTCTSPLPACHHSRRRRPHGAHEQHLSPARRHHCGCAATVPNLKMLRVQFRNMM